MIYLDEKDGFIYAECSECQRVLKFKKNILTLNHDVYKLNEPVQCFCENYSSQIVDVPQKQNPVVSQTQGTAPGMTPKNDYRPHCPTCGSTNVHKISVGSKVVGGAMFGLFSSNVRKSYCCDNCGYKW